MKNNKLSILGLLYAHSFKQILISCCLYLTANLSLAYFDVGTIKDKRPEHLDLHYFINTNVSQILNYVFAALTLYLLFKGSSNALMGENKSFKRINTDKTMTFYIALLYHILMFLLLLFFIMIARYLVVRLYLLRYEFAFYNLPLIYWDVFQKDFFPYSFLAPSSIFLLFTLANIHISLENRKGRFYEIFAALIVANFLILKFGGLR